MNSQETSILVIAHIAESILPIARGEKYEEPLSGALARTGLGAVYGAGSVLGAGRTVEAVEIELTLVNLERALHFARDTLKGLGAPAGSLLLFLREGHPRALDIHSGDESDHSTALEVLARHPPPVPFDEDEERERVRATAAKVLKDFESLWKASYEYPDVDLSTCDPALVLRYDEATEALAARGFRPLADIATVRTDLPVRKSLGFSRKLLSRDGNTRADVFASPTAKAAPIPVIVLKTEFEDGRFLGTSNAVLRFNSPDFVDDERLPAATVATAIAERHAERLVAQRKSQPFARVRSLTSLPELVASEKRERELTRSFRQRQGIPTVEELQRLGAAADFAARVHEEIKRLGGL